MRLAICLTCVVAWWDQGHMLIASVARTWLTQIPIHRQLPWTASEGLEVVEKFHAVLNLWRGDFPEYNELISASVWADHIKCRSKNNLCAKSYGIEIFNSNHFVDINYNNSMSEAQRLAALEHSLSQKDNAYFLLETIHASFSNSTAFASNLLIRLFLHIFGDIHQPLHAMRYAGDCLPDGDRGGTGILVKNIQEPTNLRAYKTYPSTLHSLWDSGGWLYTQNYPNFTVNESNAMGAAIARKYPNESFSDIRKVIEDSYSLAPEVYGAVIKDYCKNLAKSVDGKGVYYVITPEYLNLVRQITEQRVATAGFSLAFYLFEFSKRLVGSNADLAAESAAGTRDGGIRNREEIWWWKIYSLGVTVGLLLALIRVRVVAAYRSSRLPFSRSYSQLMRFTAQQTTCNSNSATNGAPAESLSCGTSDNISDRFFNPDLDEILISERPTRVVVSNANITMKTRSK